MPHLQQSRWGPDVPEKVEKGSHLKKSERRGKGIVTQLPSPGRDYTKLIEESEDMPSLTSGLTLLRRADL